MLKFKAFAKTFFASVFLLISIALFIPAPHSDISETYSFSVAGAIIQLSFFIMSRLLSEKFSYPKSIVRVVFEALIFLAIIAFHVEALMMIETTMQG